MQLYATRCDSRPICDRCAQHWWNSRHRRTGLEYHAQVNTSLRSGSWVPYRRSLAFAFLLSCSCGPATPSDAGGEGTLGAAGSLPSVGGTAASVGGSPSSGGGCSACGGAAGDSSGGAAPDGGHAGVAPGSGGTSGTAGGGQGGAGAGAGGESNVGGSGGTANTTPGVRIVGRTAPGATGTRFAWSGSSVAARFTGTQVSAQLDDGDNGNSFQVV
ncbi:MAG: Carbohydrate esterase 2 N-terminal, partial [Pseudomonadota bacterium]